MAHILLASKKRDHMDKTHNVAVIVGSLRKDSINRKVANALVEVAPEGLKLSFVEIGQFPGRAHHVDDLSVLFAGQFVQYVPHLVIAAALYGLVASKYRLDPRAHGFGAVDHKKILLVGAQTLIA